MSILFSAGEVGSFNAIFKCFEVFQNKRECYFHFTELSKKNCSPDSLLEIDLSSPLLEIKRFLESKNIDTLLYSVNLFSNETRQLAGICKKLDIKLLHVLDYWNGYIERLRVGNEIIFPHIYLVPDSKAFTEAIAEGIPEDIIIISGNPAFSDKLNIYQELKSSSAFKPTPKKIAFIAEPILQDQGDESAETFRGYSEQSVLSLFSKSLESIDAPAVDIIPHPRQDLPTLKSFLSNLGNDSFKLRQNISITKSFHEYQGIVGMSSSVLYEAWLFGLPTLSIQPNLRNPSLKIAMQRKGICLVLNQDHALHEITQWLSTLTSNPNIHTVKFEELNRHVGSIKIIESLLSLPDNI
jgi:hypothetical protein